jgi:hypothetical protein
MIGKQSNGLTVTGWTGKRAKTGKAKNRKKKEKSNPESRSRSTKQKEKDKDKEAQPGPIFARVSLFDVQLVWWSRSVRSGHETVIPVGLVPRFFERWERHGG